MRDRPNGAALLEVARRSLLDDVAPGLKGQPRYVLLMVANAMGIAVRELREADRTARAHQAVLDHATQADQPSEGAVERLVEAMRAGRHDGDQKLYGALTETVAIAASIWKPSSATRSN